jgi:hypothetical protein
MGFKWCIRVKPVSWEQRYEELKEYQSHVGHVNVPVDYEPNKSLGKWVASQRFQYNKGLLANDRIERLAAIGFKWRVRERVVDRMPWEQRYEELKEYQLHMEHVNVPQVYEPNKSLGKWVHRQRVQYRKGLLTNDRIERLEAIGFQWVGPSSHTKAISEPMGLGNYDAANGGNDDIQDDEDDNDPQMDYDNNINNNHHPTDGSLLVAGNSSNSTYRPPAAPPLLKTSRKVKRARTDDCMEQFGPGAHKKKKS